MIAETSPFTYHEKETRVRDIPGTLICDNLTILFCSILCFLANLSLVQGGVELPKSAIMKLSIKRADEEAIDPRNKQNKTVLYDKF